VIADNNSSDRLDTDKLTWAALLGRWMAFAKNAVALPDDDAGRRLRNSVVDLITLQAVWFALQNLDDLDPDERALGIDRADLLIQQHAKVLRRCWGDADLPPQVSELIEQATRQLTKARCSQSPDSSGSQ
jgi:hypothetical protein